MPGPSETDAEAEVDTWTLPLTLVDRDVVAEELFVGLANGIPIMPGPSDTDAEELLVGPDDGMPIMPAPSDTDTEPVADTWTLPLILVENDVVERLSDNVDIGAVLEVDDEGGIEDGEVAGVVKLNVKLELK